MLQSHGMDQARLRQAVQTEPRTRGVAEPHETRSGGKHVVKISEHISTGRASMGECRRFTLRFKGTRRRMRLASRSSTRVISDSSSASCARGSSAAAIAGSDGTLQWVQMAIVKGAEVAMGGVHDSSLI